MRKILIRTGRQDDLSKCWFLVDAKTGKYIHDTSFKTQQSVTNMCDNIKSLIDVEFIFE